MKASLPARTAMMDAGTQTENQWFSRDVDMQAEPEEIQLVTDTVGTQTELDAVNQADDAVKYCEGIVDAKYIPLITRYDGVFKDAKGKQ